MTEVFELLGRIAVEGVDEAENAITDMAEKVRAGSEKIGGYLENIRNGFSIGENIRNDASAISGIMNDITAVTENHINDTISIKAEIPQTKFNVPDDIWNLSGESLVKNAEKTASDIKEILDGITLTIPNEAAWDIGKDKLYSELANIKKLLPNEISKAGANYKTELDKIYIDSVSKWDKIGTSASGRINGISDTVKSVINAAERNNKSGLERIYRDSISEWNKTGKTAYYGISGISDTVKSVINAAERNNKSGLERIYRDSVSEWNKTGKTASYGISGISDTVRSVINAAEHNNKSGLERIYRDSVSEWSKIEKSASDGMNNMSEAIYSGISMVRESCMAAAAAAEKALTVDGSSAGRYLIDSMDSGIAERAWTVYQTASDVAANISSILSSVTVSVNSAVSSGKLIGHAKGGIVTREHIARVGEDGAEAIIPLEHNTEWIDRVAERLNGSGSGDVIAKLDELNSSIKSLKIYLDGEALVGGIAPAMDKKLGSISRLKRRSAI